MKKNNASIESFAHHMSSKVMKMTDRAVAILYFYAVNKDTGASLKQIISDFDRAGLGKPNITKLRRLMIKDRRTVKISDDSWRLKSDKIIEVGDEFQLSQYFVTQQSKPITVEGNFIDKNRFRALKKKKDKFDFSRLLKMLTELDYAFSVGSYISVTFLVRAILDHVPPIFSLDSFIKIANNYGSKSFKDSMVHLDNSSRKIADAYLHTQIRSKETLPSKTQVNFSSDLDVLLAEIVRIS